MLLFSQEQKKTSSYFGSARGEQTWKYKICAWDQFQFSILLKYGVCACDHFWGKMDLPRSDLLAALAMEIWFIQLNFQLLLFNHGERDLNQFSRYYHCNALALNRSVMQVHKSINPLKMTPPPLPFETFYKVICFGTVTRLLVLHVFMMWILLRASQGTHV